MLGRAARTAPALFLAACGLPNDPDGTSERIASTGELRVGITDNPPWVAADGPEPSGIEPALVRAFARGLGAKILWTRGSETHLTHALDDHELDLVVGGFEKKTPWAAHVAVSQPYVSDADGKKHVFLAAPGENAFLLEVDRFLAERKRAAGSAK